MFDCLDRKVFSFLFDECLIELTISDQMRELQTGTPQTLM